jgi:lipid-A-disaccharide synthase
MGLVELAGNLRNIWRAYALLKRTLQAPSPQSPGMIDFPNSTCVWHVLAKSLGIPVLYYVSPQIWAWRKKSGQADRSMGSTRWRSFFLSRRIFMSATGVKVSFVGHPLLEIVKPNAERAETLTKLGSDPNRPVIALLPGSRSRRSDTASCPRWPKPPLDLRASVKRNFFAFGRRPSMRAELRSWLDQTGAICPLSKTIVMARSRLLTWPGRRRAQRRVEIALLRPADDHHVYRLSWLTLSDCSLARPVDHIGMVNLIAGQRTDAGA